MGYTSIEFVKALAQIKYGELGFSSETDYDNFIQKIINYASALIDEYCGQSFNEPVPQAVSYAAAMIAVNMLHEMLQRKINPVIQATNMVTKDVEQDAFKEGIKKMLDTYRRVEVHRG